MATKHLSTHFTLKEFRCPCCGVEKALPALVTGLERLRALAYPSGLVIASGYRCSSHNPAVGGAKGSQHLYGAAADVDLRATLEDVKALTSFSGIGYQHINGKNLVRHVDVRHVSGHNATGGTPSHPTTWRY